MTVRDCYADDEGGGIHMWSGTTEIIDSALIDNVADYEGGGIEVDSSGVPATLLMERTVVEGNVADYEGGGLAIGAWDHDLVTLIDVTFRENSAGYSGGAISAGSWDQVTLVVTNGTFEGNIAPTGGAIEFDPNQQVWAEFVGTVTTVVSMGAAVSFTLP